jgi:hypothetical protein
MYLPFEGVIVSRAFQVVADRADRGQRLNTAVFHPTINCFSDTDNCQYSLLYQLFDFFRLTSLSRETW